MSACIDGVHYLGCQKIRTVHFAIPVEYRSHLPALREFLSLERNILYCYSLCCCIRTPSEER